MPPAPDEPLLLHSLSEFGSLVFDALEAVEARSIAEIGSESGAFSERLHAWARERGGKVWAVDPVPPRGLRVATRSDPSLHVVARPSPDALEDVEPCDAYFVDGDHNYHSVTRELEEIFAGVPAGRPAPLVVLHDVGWPCARRDQYYAPEALPPEAVHPYSYDLGKVPGLSELVAGGFRGELSFASALHEGGPRNGVLTAVEDFLAEREDLVLRTVPIVFGLGFVYSRTAPSAARLDELLEPFDDNPVLERLERNRVRLFTRTLQLQHELDSAAAGPGRLLAELDERVAALEAENSRLRLELGRARPVVAPE